MRATRLDITCHTLPDHTSSPHELSECLGLSVRTINLLLVLRHDSLSVQLLCRCDKVVLWCPLLFRQDDALEKFNTSQTSLLAGLQEKVEDDAGKLLVVNELFQMLALDSILLRNLGEDRLVGDNNGNGLVFIFGSVNQNVEDGRARSIDGFEL